MDEGERPFILSHSRAYSHTHTQKGKENLKKYSTLLILKKTIKTVKTHLIF